MSSPTTIPDLDWDYPPCPLCDETVSSDGSACWCDHCGLVWDEDGTKGEPSGEATCDGSCKAGSRMCPKPTGSVS